MITHDLPEVLSEPEPTPEPLTPAARIYPDTVGTAVVLADGQTWLLADVVPDLRCEVWDALYEDNRVNQRYDPADVAVAACWLLMANYRLDLAEAHDLIAGTDPKTLVRPVEVALFGINHVRAGSFSDWVLAGLWSNGIDPDRLPRHLLWPVMLNLERMGRVPPRSAAVKGDVIAAERAHFLAVAGSSRRPAPGTGP